MRCKPLIVLSGIVAWFGQPPISLNYKTLHLRVIGWLLSRIIHSSSVSTQQISTFFSALSVLFHNSLASYSACSPTLITSALGKILNVVWFSLHLDWLNKLALNKLSYLLVSFFPLPSPVLLFLSSIIPSPLGNYQFLSLIWESKMAATYLAKLLLLAEKKHLPQLKFFFSSYDGKFYSLGYSFYFLSPFFCSLKSENVIKTCWGCLVWYESITHEVFISFIMYSLGLTSNWDVLRCYKTGTRKLCNHIACVQNKEKPYAFWLIVL